MAHASAEAATIDLRPKVEISAFVFNIAWRHGATKHCQNLRTNVNDIMTKIETRINEHALNKITSNKTDHGKDLINVCYNFHTTLSNPNITSCKLRKPVQCTANAYFRRQMPWKKAVVTLDIFGFSPILPIIINVCL